MVVVVVRPRAVGRDSIHVRGATIVLWELLLLQALI